MKRIAADTDNFEGLITKGYTYVDKAVVLSPLVSHNFGEHIFLSRPHRSGDFIGEERVLDM